MKIRKEAILLPLLALVLGACSEDNPWAGSRGQGGIDLKLSANADVQDALPLVRAGAPELVAPDVEDFSIRLTNLDTDQQQTWRSLADFNSESGFDVGSYTLTAFYGDVNECGFDKPCFIGETTVNVLESRQSEASVTATLANVMVSIDYTDNFRTYFRDYSVTAHTDGHANVMFGKTETRAGFLTPGDVTLQVSLTNTSGKSVTIAPAQFPAQARHHYHVTFDVNSDPMGSVALEVIFDDSTTKENVIFNLSDELYNADAPVVNADGFVSGQTVEALAGNAAPAKLMFETVCKAGIQSAVLKIAKVSGSVDYRPAFGNELDLIQADEATQHQLEQSGIKVAGLFKNPEMMAFVDVTELPKYLPEGTFEITLTVTDKLGRNNETPKVLSLSTLPINLSVVEESSSAVYVYPGPATTTSPTVDATVMVVYNGLNPEQSISFQNKCRTGIYKDCDIVDVKESTATRGFPDKTYLFNIKVCDVETSPLPMKLFFNGVEKEDFTINVIEPEYSVEGDAFATYARLKVTTANAADLPTIVNGLTLYKNGEPISNNVVTTDPEKGMLTLDGLTPDTDYTIGYSLTKRNDGNYATVDIHTEKDAQIPNSDFSQTEHLIINNLQVGGQYRTSAAGIYKNYASIDREIPISWATINPKTCKADAANLNTWFVVPSTYVENGRIKIRNVGFSHNGTTPDQTGNLANTTYYNTNAASFNKSEKVSGELFLGSYSFTSKENRTMGIAFGSRPNSLSFEYTYEPLAGSRDKGLVEIEIIDANGTILSDISSELDAESNLTKMTLKLPSYEFGSRAAGIRLLFKSSKVTEDAPIHIPSGNELNDGAPSRGYTFPNPNHYNAVATGSVLTIDNVKLNY